MLGEFTNEQKNMNYASLALKQVDDYKWLIEDPISGNAVGTMTYTKTPYFEVRTFSPMPGSTQMGSAWTPSLSNFEQWMSVTFKQLFGTDKVQITMPNGQVVKAVDYFVEYLV